MIEGQFTECWHCPLEDDTDPRQDPEARCDECGYQLWKLPERRCPECGSRF
jgi:DNA-directed RNA polymerase subunit RPC12/RpoP